VKVFALHREQSVPRPRAEVFALFERPENLALITPASLGFQLLTPGPIEMRAGALIDYVIHVLGLPVRWTTLIAAYEPPHRFVDVQLRGPYTFWHHTHTFAEADGRTRITDDVRYALPFGPLGVAVHALLVRRQLAGIFAHRSEVIGRLFA
jgi:ligand-binding SRPBCC domain-containing protein